MTPSSQRLSDEQMRRTWALVDILTSLKRRANHHQPHIHDQRNTSFHGNSCQIIELFSFFLICWYELT